MKATVVKNTRISDKFGYLELKCPEIKNARTPTPCFFDTHVFVADILCPIYELIIFFKRCANSSERAFMV